MGMSEIIALGCLIVAALSLFVSARKDTRTDAGEKARTEATLDSIRNGVDDIRVEQRSVRNRVDNMSTDLARLESSCSSAHHRLDTMEQRLNHTTTTE